jgi:hypothetical protein
MSTMKSRGPAYNTASRRDKSPGDPGAQDPSRFVLTRRCRVPRGHRSPRERRHRGPRAAHGVGQTPSRALFRRRSTTEATSTFAHAASRSARPEQTQGSCALAQVRIPSVDVRATSMPKYEAFNNRPKMRPRTWSSRLSAILGVWVLVSVGCAAQKRPDQERGPAGPVGPPGPAGPWAGRAPPVRSESPAQPGPAGPPAPPDP